MDITITQNRYEGLLEEHFEYNLLLNTIFNFCKYYESSWNGSKDLKISDEEPIMNLLKSLHPTRYDAVMRYAKEEAEKAELARKQREHEEENDEV